MANDTFYDNGGYDLSFQIWADSTIENCTFYDSDAALMFYRGTHLVTNCTFYQTSVIVSRLVDCVIQDTTFEGEKYNSLRVDDFGTLYLYRVVFSNYTSSMVLLLEGEANVFDTTIEYCDTLMNELVLSPVWMSIFMCLFLVMIAIGFVVMYRWSHLRELRQLEQQLMAYYPKNSSSSSSALSNTELGLGGRC